jgi:hypothetical protein
VEGERNLWVDLNGFVEIGDRVEVVLTVVADTAIVEGEGILGIDANDLIEIRDRLIVFALTVVATPRSLDLRARVDLDRLIVVSDGASRSPFTKSVARLWKRWRRSR